MDQRCGHAITCEFKNAVTRWPFPFPTEHGIPNNERINELSPVRLPLAFAASLIRFYMGALPSALNTQ